MTILITILIAIGIFGSVYWGLIAAQINRDLERDLAAIKHLLNYRTLNHVIRSTVVIFNNVFNSNYSFPINLAPIGIPIDAKSIA